MRVAAAECEARWMCAAQAVGSAGRRWCRCRHCITIALRAAPQASFACFTKGISSQMPEGSAAKSTLPTHSTRTMTRTTRGIGLLLPYRDDNQNQTRDDDQNTDQVPVAEGAGAKVALRLFSRRRQWCHLRM